MSGKDLRDIAAYWTVQYSVPHDKREHGFMRTVDNELLNWLENEGAVPGFKLQLRSIASLTDSEVLIVAETAFGRPIDKANARIIRDWPDHPIWYGEPMVRTDGNTYHLDYWLSDSGLFGSGDGYDGSEISTYGEAAVFAYLQYIGVYVPGTINLEYVQLI